MPAPYTRTSIHISKEENREIEQLVGYLQENRNQVVKRALRLLYAEMLKRKDFILYVSEENKK